MIINCLIKKYCLSYTQINRIERCHEYILLLCYHIVLKNIDWQ